MIITSSEKIHKLLTPLKFEVLDVARKTINAIPSQFLLNVSGSFYLYVTTIYLDFLHLYFSESGGAIFLRAAKIREAKEKPSVAKLVVFELPVY